MNKQPPDLLAIVGATASGKTDYALKLAREQDAELVSVDSRQVYRTLSVGTAKPAGEWSGQPKVYRVEGVPYHLLDIWEPDQPFTAANFVELANQAIQEIQSRGKTPIFVGGTGLYYKALTEGLAKLPPADGTIRSELRAKAEEQGRPHLHAQLAQVDPEAARAIPENNIQRVIRALEVFQLTGRPISAFHKEHQAEREKKGPLIHLKMLGLEWTKPELHLRIEERCSAMLENGMIEETESLLEKGIPSDAPALTGLGYPRIVDFLNGKLEEDYLLDALIGDTRAYAKRQLTWFRNQAEVRWIPADQ